MKITKSQLKQIIKEELENVIDEGYFDLEAFREMDAGPLMAEFARNKEDIERACKEQIDVLRREMMKKLKEKAPSGEEGWSLSKWLRKQAAKAGLS